MKYVKLVSSLRVTYRTNCKAVTCRSSHAISRARVIHDMLAESRAGLN